MKRFNILLLNCTPKKDPNEAEFLSAFFTMMQTRYPKSIKFKSKQITSKKTFLNLISEDWANIIHISAHGDSTKYPSGRRGKETSISLPRNSVSSKEISQRPKVKTKLVFVSACLASYEDMANAFLERGVARYIAPKSKVEWVNAALFSVMFYKKFVYDRIRFESAFRFAKRNSKLGSDFPEYWYR